MDTTKIDVPNSRAIAKQLLTLAQDVDNQPFIVQEHGCIAGLVSYLDHVDVDVVLMSSRALQFLSSHPQNKKRMREFPNLVTNLVRLYNKGSTHPKAKEFACNALDGLGVSYHKDNNNENENNVNINSQQQPASEPTPKKKKPLGVRPLHTITLNIQGISDPKVCESVKNTLIRVSGVISVTVDQDHGRATIGTREDDTILESLKSALAKAGSTADVYKPVNKKEELPDYCDEADYDEDEVDFAAISRWGAHSLEARLDSQLQAEEEKRKQEKSSRLIGKVGSALGSAGSWLMGW